MAHKTHNNWISLLGILMPLLASLACLTGTAVIPDSTSMPDPASTPEVGPVEVDLQVGPGDLFYPDPRAGLVDLATYKGTLAISFEGTENGQPQPWSKTYVMLYSREPAARQLTIDSTGSISAGEPAFLAEVNGVAYDIQEGGVCIGSVLDPANSFAQQLEPAGMLTGLLGAEAAGYEAVNSIEADHYTFDERALAQAGLNHSTGEVWVASSGGYIVRYLLTTTGDAEYFGEGFKGTMRWDYQLTDVNQPLTFGLPADCPQGLVDAPLLPEASIVLSLSGFLKYDTTSSLSEVVAFYQSRMLDLGWTPLGEPALTDTTAFFEFTQGDQILSIVSVTGEASTTVQIALSRSEN